MLADLDARGAALPASPGPERRWSRAPDRVKLLTGRTYEPAEGIKAPAGGHGPAADIGLTKRRSVGVPGNAGADLAPGRELTQIIPDDRALGAHRGTSQRIRAVRSSLRTLAVGSFLRTLAVGSFLRTLAVGSFLRTRTGRRPGFPIVAATCVWPGGLIVLAPVPDIGAT